MRDLRVSALALSIVAIVISVAAIVLAIYGSIFFQVHQARSAMSGVGLGKGASGLIASALSGVIDDAREGYLRAVEGNRSWSIYIGSSFARSLLLNSTVLSDSEILVNGSRYVYLVLALRRGSVVVDVDRASIDGLAVEELPRNRSVTYTGCQPSFYLVRVGNESCRFGAHVCGLAISSYSVYVNAWKVCRGTYFAWIWMWSRHEYVWMLLKKVG